MKSTNVLDAILICITAVALPIAMGVIGISLWWCKDLNALRNGVLALIFVAITFFGLLIAKVLIAVIRGIFEIRFEL